MARQPNDGRGAPHPDELVENVGVRLRLRRVEQDISLRELSRRLGISASALSQIETGKSRASVNTLYSIVTELGISLDELFDGLRSGGAQATVVRARRPPESAAAPAETRASTGRPGLVQRAGSRNVLELESGVRWERLTAASDPQADFLYVVYDVGGSSSSGEKMIRHTGREYGLVLSGVLEVTVGFDTYELGPGDSISFDSATPHRLQNRGTEPVHGVWFVVGRGADLRLAFDQDETAGADGA